MKRDNELEREILGDRARDPSAQAGGGIFRLEHTSLTSKGIIAGRGAETRTTTTPVHGYGGGRASGRAGGGLV